MSTTTTHPSTAGWLYEYTFRFAAPREELFAALSDGDRLTAWFAEHADVSPVPGAPWRFWGKHTLGTPSAPNPNDVLLEMVPATKLRFVSTIAGTPSEVTLSLADDPDKSGVAGTNLTVQQRLDGDIPYPRGRAMVDDFWRLSFGNLTAHLSGGSGLLRPDLADLSPQIRVSIVIDAPRAAVFRALLVPEALNKWVASAASVTPEVGGEYRYGWNYQVDGRDVAGGPTKILALVPDEKLVTDWADWRGDPAVPAQRITWLLESEGESTRVTVVHDGFVRSVDVSDYPFGWTWFLSELSRYVRSA